MIQHVHCLEHGLQTLWLKRTLVYTSSNPTLRNGYKGMPYILGLCVNLVKPLSFWLEGGIDIAVMATMNP